jgi:A/G-specific adenine glycosylase
MKFKESEIFLSWYRKNRRNLPWRMTRDPYLIWISEIIMQQTRVNQGLSYYEMFAKTYPCVKSLAAAPREAVLKLWQGLGYYSRARNLHEAALDIVNRFGGIFPRRYEDILSLKGIGEYTAAAIASFAWNDPYPVVDGNVFRVLSRLFACEIPIDTTTGKKQYTALASQLMDPANAGLHNQAIMEFGALQCTPTSPDCPQCPFADRCLGFATGNPERFPLKNHKVKPRDRYLNYLDIRHGRDVYLHCRGGNDIWEGLYEFPLIETVTAVDFVALQSSESFESLFQDAGELSITLTKSVKHVLTHQILHVTFYRIQLPTTAKTLKNYLRVPENDLDKYPVPILIHNYLAG